MTHSTKKITVGILSVVSLFSYFAFADDHNEVDPVNKIEIKDFMFNPATISVKSGQQITWINRDEEPHTVVSVEKQFKKSPPLDTDQVFTITVNTPGTYTYFCSVHPKMTGIIIVEKS